MHRIGIVGTAVVLSSIVMAPGAMAGIDWEQRLVEYESRLKLAPTEADRFNLLPEAAQAALQVGEMEQALVYATQSLKLAESYPQSWNYGNALHRGHLVFGHFALQSGNLKEAKRELLEAGDTPGSPQLDTFGPNMSLAQDLLQVGERDTVLAYLELCRAFWENDDGKLDAWKRDIVAGRTPDFGANAEY